MEHRLLVDTDHQQQLTQDQTSRTGLNSETLDSAQQERVTEHQQTDLEAQTTPLPKFPASVIDKAAKCQLVKLPNERPDEELPAHLSSQTENLSLPAKVASPIEQLGTMASGQLADDNIEMGLSDPEENELQLLRDQQQEHINEPANERFDNASRSVVSLTLEEHPVMGVFAHAEAGFRSGANPTEVLKKLVLEDRWKRWYTLQEGVKVQLNLEDFLRSGACHLVCLSVAQLVPTSPPSRSAEILRYTP